MGNLIYDRESDTAILDKITEMQAQVNDIKSPQIIGNDNLRVSRFMSSLSGQTITATVTAIFKFTFTFDEPSTSYVLPRFSVYNQTSSYNAAFYADPATVNDTTKKSWFYSITTTGTVNNVILGFSPQCSDQGVASITRVV